MGSNPAEGYDIKVRVTCVQVLEPQNVDPSMVQMTFLDDVVHSLLKGENIGITSRRRSRSSQNSNTAHVSRNTLKEKNKTYTFWDFILSHYVGLLSIVSTLPKSNVCFPDMVPHNMHVVGV